MPVIDEIASEYADRVAFVAAAWKGTPEATAERAGELIPSGNVAWGLDVDETVFSAYNIPYQPVTVLIDAHMHEVARWPGVQDPDQIRLAIEELLLGA